MDEPKLSSSRGSAGDAPVQRPSSEVIPPALEEELERLGVDISNPEISRAVEVVLSKTYAGPMMLPPAFVLEEYKKEFPEIVPKLLQWTDKQIDHRQAIEWEIVRAAERRKDRSQLGAAGVAVIGLLCSTVMAMGGATAAAVVTAIVAVGGPVAAYTLARFAPGAKGGDVSSSDYETD